MTAITVHQAKKHFEYTMKLLMEECGMSFRSSYEPAFRALLALGVHPEVAEQAASIACL